MKSSLVLLSLVTLLALCQAEELTFQIEKPVAIQTSRDGSLYFAQPRAAVIPSDPWRVLLTMQEMEGQGTHSYRDVFTMETTDGLQWSTPSPVDSLRRASTGDGYDRVIGDAYPKWHAKTQKILVTGKTFNFRDGTTEDRSVERVSYCVYSPTTKTWSGMNIFGMPEKDHEGHAIIAPNSGCVQRVDLPDGDILLPVRYSRNQADQKTPYCTTVVRCGFDGEKLTYKEHGNEMSVPDIRGLYEPSLTTFGDKYFLTLRNDKKGYVARSTDGLHYEEVQEWKYDDGQRLPTYNTQQHWVTHSSGLYLVYTRKGANNDHIMRNRAPLFIAKVDPEKLCVIRSTEQVLFPEEGADLGNFGVLNASRDETWILTSETSLAKTRPEGPHRVLLAKIQWSQPNLLFPLN